MEGILDTYYYALKSCILFKNFESFSNKILFERAIFFGSVRWDKISNYAIYRN